MARGITEQEPDPRIVYADIIDRPHWRSPTRTPMSLYDRSAQFASYKALAGYEDMVAEEVRQTEAAPAPEEFALERLDRRLGALAAALRAGEHPTAVFTVYVPDAKKPGGGYEEITAQVKRLDPALRQLVLGSAPGPAGKNRVLELDKIVDIDIPEESDG